ncbi:hypothetical protein HAX54_047889 [Datura stramonium]|uniref:Uncharacterized protein n=1 Tax=Datura stramonium TaxID=4076 RepID=A0ABS8WNE5_DATST|nr:hypothetical protein [Datura stramonium]
MAPHRHSSTMACTMHRQGWCREQRDTPRMWHYGLHDVQINLSLEEMTEAERAEVARLVEEARQVEAARRVEAENFTTALEERNRQNHPRHHGRNDV